MSLPTLPQWTALTRQRRVAEAERCRAARDKLDAAFSLFAADGDTCASGAAPSTDGPLAGLPYAAKDMFDRPGRAPSCGLAAPFETPPKQSAAILDRMDAAGADCIGFARMAKLAYEPSGFATARNPWNPDFAPGGSSSGSAAAVASGAVFVALGSDTGGSVRIPAHCCGVTGWKPSTGLVPANGAMPLAPSLDTIGILARGAADILMVAEATGLLPSGDAGTPHRGIAVAEDLLQRAEPSIRVACEAGIDHFLGLGYPLGGRSAGPAVDANGDAALRVLQAEAARGLGASTALAEQDPELARRLASGGRIDDATLRRDLDGRDAARAAFLASVFGDSAFLLTPVMAIRTPTLAEVDPAAPSFSGCTLYALSAFLRFANYLGLPALALPTGIDDRGMPVGLQLVGRPGSDRALLELGTAFQATSSWHGRMPPLAQPILQSTESLVA
ncbi:amidase [Aurantimonas sp. DM33-3]|uniref:amidase n=1 Tax=Aurantimonas sp. DM33-3 TaxID=2766955 RepID=UPI00165227F9|nr:amidase [Aurantimonas sp. DM33-3]MBC6718586.1 amidase [Aurantimonas sp. DM33-3]